MLVLDNCMGVITGAVVERMGGRGSACISHVDRPFCANAVKEMNLSDAERAVVCYASVAQLRQAQAGPASEARASWGKRGIDERCFCVTMRHLPYDGCHLLTLAVILLPLC